MPKVGNKIPLFCQLFDGATNMYVRAYLVNSDLAFLPQSPVNLTNAGNGTYESNAVVMPDTEFVVAIYKVFQDAVYTIPSDTHADCEDIFELFEFDSETIIDLLIDIRNNVNTLLAQGIAMKLVGYIEEGNMLKGELEDNEITLKGEIENNELIGIIDNNDNLVGYIEPDELEGVL